MWVVLGVLSVLAVPTARRQLVLPRPPRCGSAHSLRTDRSNTSLACDLLLCASGTIGVRLRSLRHIVGRPLRLPESAWTAVLVGSAAKGGDDSHGLSDSPHLCPHDGRASRQPRGGIRSRDGRCSVRSPSWGRFFSFSDHHTGLGSAEKFGHFVILTTSLLASLATFGGIYLAGLGQAWRPSAPPDRSSSMPCP